MIKKFLQSLSPSVQTTERAGVVSRVGFAHAHSDSRGHYVLSLEGDPTIYRLAADAFEHAEVLAMTRDGDEVAFALESWEEDLGARCAVLQGFSNLALSAIHGPVLGSSRPPRPPRRPG